MVTTIALILSLATSTPEGLFGKKGGSCSNGSCSVAVAPEKTVEAKPASAPVAAPVSCSNGSCVSEKHHTRLFRFRLRGGCAGGSCR